MKKILVTILFSLFLLQPVLALASINAPNLNVYNWDGSLEKINNAVSTINRMKAVGKVEPFSLGSMGDRSIAVIDINEFSENLIPTYIEIAKKINSPELIAERRKKMLTNLNYIQPYFVINKSGNVFQVR